MIVSWFSQNMITFWGNYCDEGYYCSVYSKCCTRGCCVSPKTNTEMFYTLLEILICFAILVLVILIWKAVKSYRFSHTTSSSFTGQLSYTTHTIRASILDLFLRPPEYSDIVSEHNEDLPPSYFDVNTDPNKYPMVVAISNGYRKKSVLVKSCTICFLNSDNEISCDHSMPYFSIREKLVQTHKSNRQNSVTKSCVQLTNTATITNSNDNNNFETLKNNKYPNNNIKVSKSFS